MVDGEVAEFGLDARLEPVARHTGGHQGEHQGRHQARGSQTEGQEDAERRLEHGRSGSWGRGRGGRLAGQASPILPTLS